MDGVLTGAENLRMMARLRKVPDGKQRTRELLGRFDLNDAADRRVASYSGGMRRRLDLAVSLIASPPVLFLDEPTTGLDPFSRSELWDMLRGLVAGGQRVDVIGDPGGLTDAQIHVSTRRDVRRDPAGDPVLVERAWPARLEQVEHVRIVCHQLTSTIRST